MLSGVEFGGVLNETDQRVSKLRAELAQVDALIDEYRRIVQAQEILNHLIARRAQLAEEVNGIIDSTEREYVPPEAKGLPALDPALDVLKLAKPLGSS